MTYFIQNHEKPKDIDKWDKVAESAVKTTLTKNPNNRTHGGILKLEDGEITVAQTWMPKTWLGSVLQLPKRKGNAL